MLNEKFVILLIAIVIVGFFVSNNISVNNLTSGIIGQVILGPFCPVERVNEAQQCYRSYQTTIDVKIVGGIYLVTKFSSDTNGNFLVYLRPGDYSLTTENNGSVYPICRQETVVVEPNKFTNITINCDTGIR